MPEPYHRSIEAEGSRKYEGPHVPLRRKSLCNLDSSMLASSEGHKQACCSLMGCIVREHELHAAFAGALTKRDA